VKLRSLAAALLSLTACSYDVVKSRELSPPGAQGAPAVGFEKVYQVSIATHCTRCHAEFTSYEAVFASRDEISRRVQSRDMPKGQVMPDDRRALLLDWLAAGAPRDPAGSGTTAPAPTPPPGSSACPDDDDLDGSTLRHGDDRCETENSPEDKR